MDPKMKTVIVLLLVLASVIGGLYVGFWLMFVGGFVDIVQAVKAPVTEIGAVAFGLLKMIFASAIGWLVCLLGFVVAAAFID